MKRSFLSYHYSSPGHRIIVRPDTYVEVNLRPAHRGAPEAYNEMSAISTVALLPCHHHRHACISPPLENQTPY